MILIDANLLVYAANADAPQHATARGWLDGRLNGHARVGLPWASLLAFLRLTTNPRVFPRPLDMKAAWGQVEAWLACEPVWIPEPTPRHGAILSRLLAAPGVHANLIPDAHLAALAIGHGLELCSSDGDFARFAELKWTDPIAGQGAAA